MKNIRKRLKYIFPALILLMILGLVLARVYQPDPSPPDPEVQISAADARDYIGTAAKVCGKVVSADYLPQVNGEPTFLNFGQAHPNQHFTGVIFGSDRGKWRKPPEHQYRNREVCIIGRIELHEGTPQITVNNPEQITIQ